MKDLLSVSQVEMISGRRSPYRRRGLLSGLLADAIDDHSQKKEDEVRRRSLNLQQKHEKKLERQLDQEGARGRSLKGNITDTYDNGGPHLPSYDHATEGRPRPLSAAPAAGGPSFASSDRAQYQQQGQHLMPPDPSIAGAGLVRPRSAQDYYEQSMSFGSEPDRHESYLRDPRLMDSFLHDPYSRGPSLFGPREPTYLSTRQGRAMISMDDRHTSVNARRRSGGRYRDDEYDDTHNRRGSSRQQGLVGTLVGAAVQSGIQSHAQRRERTVSMEPPAARPMNL